MPHATDLTTQLGRLTLPNPIMVASGTFGYAREAQSFGPLAQLGAIVPKTVTAQMRKGTRPPRVVETASGMLNAIGLDNDGIDHFLEHHLPFLSLLKCPLIVNVAGKTIEEFWELAKKLDGRPEVAGVELNLSCPNVSGGTDFATDPTRAGQVIQGVRENCDRPILAKLTPNVTDLASVAKACEDHGADAVTLINTVLAMAVDWRKQKPLLSNVVGGLSGPAIKPIALRAVWQVRQKCSLAVVGVGGIHTIDDVMEFLVTGASAVQVGTANFYQPTLAHRLVDELPKALTTLGVSEVGAVVGSLRSN